jgi:hypothetical protein
VPIDLDVSRALRTRAELTALAGAVAAAPKFEPETDAIEWKRALDLSGGWAHRFELSKHILGFGNRMPVAAATSFEGCAYLLVGVEPQSVAGCDGWDPADLEGWIGRYVGPGSPRWTPNYVELAGSCVLIITIEAPRPGDGIHSLQTTYESHAEGRIFIRRHGKTVEASPAELRQLEARLLGRETEVELDVRIAGKEPDLVALSYDEALLERWIQDEADRLWRPIEPRDPPQRGPFDFPITYYDTSRLLDSRSKKQYVAECEAYLESAPLRWRAIAEGKAVEGGLGRLSLEVHNPTRGNWERVEIVLDIPRGIAVYFDEEEPFDALEAPDRPATYGSPTALALPATRAFRVADGNQVRRTDSGAQVRFAPFHLRPGRVESLDPLFLLPDPELVGGDVDVSWRATSTNAHGWVEGVFRLHVAEEPAVYTAVRNATED